MFGDLPAGTPVGAVTAGAATCGIEGGGGGEGIDTLGDPICGTPEIGAAGGAAPKGRARFEIIIVYSLGPCGPLAGVAD